MSTIYSMNKSSFKFSKLSFKHSYLKMEREDVFKSFEEGDIDLRKYLVNNYPDEMKRCFSPEEPKKEVSKNKEPSERDTERHHAKKSIAKNKDVKKLYRKIAAKIHPDKVGSNEYSAKFSEAAEAYQNNDLGKLLEISSAINIEITDLSEESLLLLEENIKFIENEVLMKKRTVGYQWHCAQSPEDKNKIVHFWFKERGITIS